MAVLEAHVDRIERPSSGRAVHDVVVDEREGVQQLERGARVDDRGITRAPARAHEGPVTERRTEALASGEDELPQRIEGFLQRRVDGGPPLQLASQQRVDAGVDPRRDLREAGGDRHGGGLGAQGPPGRAVGGHPATIRPFVPPSVCDSGSSPQDHPADETAGFMRRARRRPVA